MVDVTPKFPLPDRGKKATGMGICEKEGAAVPDAKGVIVGGSAGKSTHAPVRFYCRCTCRHKKSACQTDADVFG